MKFYNYIAEILYFGPPFLWTVRGKEDEAGESWVREGVTTITLPQEATVPPQDRPLTHAGSAFPDGPFGPINPHDAIGPGFSDCKRSVRRPSTWPSAALLTDTEACLHARNGPPFLQRGDRSSTGSSFGRRGSYNSFLIQLQSMSFPELPGRVSGNYLFIYLWCMQWSAEVQVILTRLIDMQMRQLTIYIYIYFVAR